MAVPGLVGMAAVSGGLGGLTSGTGALCAQPTDGFSRRDERLFARLEFLNPRQQYSLRIAFELDGVRGLEFLGALELFV
jgi:hypothetical protein